jgi:hypothetical protein
MTSLAERTAASGNTTVTIWTVCRRAVFTADCVDGHTTALADCAGTAAGCLACEKFGSSGVNSGSSLEGESQGGDEEECKVLFVHRNAGCGRIGLEELMSGG